MIDSDEDTKLMKETGKLPDYILASTKDLFSLILENKRRKQKLSLAILGEVKGMIELFEKIQTEADRLNPDNEQEAYGIMTTLQEHHENANR